MPQLSYLPRPTPAPYPKAAADQEVLERGTTGPESLGGQPNGTAPGSIIWIASSHLFQKARHPPRTWAGWASPHPKVATSI